MNLPHPIPYQGSKRILARFILEYFPNEVDTLIEPFSGSAAISIASIYYQKSEKIILNDINKPLMDLWFSIIHDPFTLSEKYRIYWNEQLVNEKEYYNEIRNKFNQSQEPSYLLYLLARCVKAAVRYNSNGEFNQSPDNRRRGRMPEKMKNDIIDVSDLLRNKVTLLSEDYRQVISMASENDLIYMDPPYEGVSTKRDNRYLNGLNKDEFIESLYQLNKDSIKYIISYDGRLGNKTFGSLLPDSLNLYRIEVEVGRSSQATLSQKKDITYESIYLSESLYSVIGKNKTIPFQRSLRNNNQQLVLFG